MDRQHPSPERDTPRSRSRHSSPGFEPPPADRDDHADSPMRKKIRLDNTDEDHNITSDMTSDTLSAVPPPQDGHHPNTPPSSAAVNPPSTSDPPAGATSNKVTLNLRTPTQIENTSSQSTKSSLQNGAVHDMSAPDPSNMTIDSPSSSQSPVVEIEVDDPEDFDEDGSAVDVVSGDAIEVDLMKRFPGALSFGHLEAARRISDTLPPDTIPQVCDWIEEWVTHTRNRRAQRLNSFMNDQDFWALLGSIFSKVLQKKIALGNLSVKSSGQSRTDLIRNLLGFYIELCGQLIYEDCQSLRRANPNENEPPNLMSVPHIRNLDRIFKAQEVPLWTLLRTKYQIATDSVRQMLAIDVVDEKWETLSPILQMIVQIAPRVHTCPSLANVLTSMVRLVGSMAALILTMDEPESIDKYQHSFRRFSGHALDMVQAVETDLLDNIGKQPSVLNVDFNRSIIYTLGDLLMFASERDDLTMGRAFTNEFPKLDPERFSKELRPCLIRQSFHFRSFWKLISKGRMELRVLGVERLRDDLITFWKDWHGKLDEVLYAIASKMVEEGVVQYLVSPDSHPQLIARSSDIAGFLLVTHHWSDELTDTVWNTITSGRDPGARSATLDMHSRMLHLATEKELPAIFRKVRALPFSLFSGELMTFVQNLIKLSRIDDAPDQEDRMEPYQLLIRLIRDANRGDFDESSNKHAIQVHSEASQMLGWLRTRRNDFIERKQLYIDCIEDALKLSQTAAGSLEAVRSLLYSTEFLDLPYILQERNLLQIVAENLIAVVDLEKSSSTKSAPSEVRSRLHLIGNLLVYGPSPDMLVDLEQALWNHLVGKDALNDASREDAWLELCNVVKCFQKAQPFIDRWIDDYLPSIEPSYFTHGVLRFLEATMAYRQRTSAPVVPAEDAVIVIPLADVLWQIVMTTPEPRLGIAATNLLSQYHLDSAFIKDAPASSINATHTSLVERCIKELSDAATELGLGVGDRTDSDKESMNIDSIKGPQYQTQDRFRRALNLLQKFLVDVRSRPAFRTPVIGADRSPPSSPLAVDPTEDQMLLMYQAFSGGAANNPRRLIVEKSATYADLHDKLRHVTGFLKVHVIAGGQVVDLEKEPEHTVSTMPKGNMLIRNTGPTVDVSIKSPPTPGKSVAEQALMMHMDQFYDFLDLDGALGSAIFEFLNGFPPHPKIQELVLSDSDSLESLFPVHHHHKMLYSIKSLKVNLQQHLDAGTTDERFILNGIKVLTQALVNPNIITPLLDNPVSVQRGFNLIDCLQNFLKERPNQEVAGAYLANEEAIVKRLVSIIQISKERWHSLAGTNTAQVFDTLIETCLHSRIAFEVFTARSDVVAIHQWLLIDNENAVLREQVGVCIQNVCRDIIGPSAVQSKEFTKFYQRVLTESIPMTASNPPQSKNFYTSANVVFQSDSVTNNNEGVLKSRIDDWGALLLSHRPSEQSRSEEPDYFILGLAQLMHLSVQTLKSFKKPLNYGLLMIRLFAKFLFPPLSDEMINLDEPEATATAVFDADTRKELYNLILSLCQNRSNYDEMITRVEALTAHDSVYEQMTWHQDRSKWLKSSAGYSGLRNLTNTCYMNSLLTQLFMNTAFRKYLLEANVADGRASQKLLLNTQELFAQMQTSRSKFADTFSFVTAIQPYEGEEIDVSIQMDVDEFFNLIFDRWESQMLTKEAKDQFRSFYGGQMVQQIKSRDCEHVSERFDNFFVIQCEVKGKANLEDSLKSYVAGDAMEGDNKYKCEKCGGRFVDAVKRSCIKELRDNVIFHLKRFDFDLTTLVRAKINDRFEFPPMIDMAPYKVDHLNDPSGHQEEDKFELVGVLVHNGTAETGHYYSYIRLRPGQHGPTDSWVEFNDAEVAEFDPNKIPDQTFGGNWNFAATDYQFQKSHSAYMLFYERISSRAHQYGKNVAEKSEEALQSSVSPATTERIARENEVLVRRYGLFSSSHSHFIRSLLVNSRNLDGGNCTEYHEFETRVLHVALEHLSQVVVRTKETPELDSTISAIRRYVSSCPHCLALALYWFSNHPNSSHSMLIAAPLSRIRNSIGDLIVWLLAELRKKDAALYGIEVDQGVEGIEHLTWSPDIGALPRLVAFLKSTIPQIGRFTRAWADYFSLWYNIADLGLPEMAVLLGEDVFADAAEILLMEPHIRVRRSARLVGLYEYLTKSKKSIQMPTLVKLLAKFLAHVEPYEPMVEEPLDRVPNFNPETGKFPVTRWENYLLHFYDKPAKQTQFLTRCIDVADPIESSWYPATIVEMLLDANPTREELLKISQTLITGIEEYIPSYIRPALKTALAFCRRCPDITLVEHILKATAENAVQLDNIGESKKTAYGTASDTTAEGGMAHLDFFWELSLSTNVACHKMDMDDPDFRPLQKLVIDWAYIWGPALLMYDDKSVRLSTVQVLASLIFNNFPDAPPEGEFNDIDDARFRAARDIFQRCRENFDRAHAYHFVRFAVSNLVEIMSCCAQWMEKVEEGEPFAERQSVTADEAVQIGRAYQACIRKWHEWQDTDVDEGYTETEREYASNFEDDSDDVTETRDD